MCGVAVQQRPGRGRPSIYCGATCRALGGYAVRRSQRLLERLEERLSWLRHAPPHDHLNEYQKRRTRGRRAVEVAAVEVEIVEVESRLRELISEPRRGKPLALPHELGVNDD